MRSLASHELTGDSAAPSFRDPHEKHAFPPRTRRAADPRSCRALLVLAGGGQEGGCEPGGHAPPQLCRGGPGVRAGAGGRRHVRRRSRRRCAPTSSPTSTTMTSRTGRPCATCSRPRLSLQEIGGEYEAALATVDALRALEDKPSPKLTTGILARAYLKAAIDTRSAAGQEFEEAFGRRYGGGGQPAALGRRQRLGQAVVRERAARRAGRGPRLRDDGARSSRPEVPRPGRIRGRGADPDADLHA